MQLYKIYIESIWIKERDNTIDFTDEPFIGPLPGVIHPVTTALQCLELFVTPELVQLIIEKSNEYSQTKRFKARRTEPAAALRSYESPITINCFWSYICIRILISIHRKLDVKSNWSTKPMLATPIFSSILPVDRYLYIESSLHFASDYEQPIPGVDEPDKIWKIRNMLTLFNDAFSSSYNLDKHISIDESLLSWKGNHSLKRYIPTKAAQFGFKIYALACSTTGYCKSILMDEGATTRYSKTCPPSLMKPGQAVWTLLESNGYTHFGHWHHLFVDNFYTDIHLFTELFDRKMNVTGTVRSNRRDLPPSILQKKWKKNEKGKRVFRFKKRFVLMNWMDSKGVRILSSLGSPHVADDVINKPQLIRSYTAGMPGVDNADQMKAGRTMTRNRGRKYYKKMFHHLLDIAMINAYVISRAIPNQKINTHQTFREDLLRQIQTKYAKQTAFSIRSQSIQIPSEQIETNHMPTFETTKHACKHCHVVGVRSNVTSVRCRTCNKWLCLSEKRNCYKEYHDITHTEDIDEAIIVEEVEAVAQVPETRRKRNRLF